MRELPINPARMGCWQVSGKVCCLGFVGSSAISRSNDYKAQKRYALAWRRTSDPPGNLVVILRYVPPRSAGHCSRAQIGGSL